MKRQRNKLFRCHGRDSGSDRGSFDIIVRAKTLEEAQEKVRPLIETRNNRLLARGKQTVMPIWDLMWDGSDDIIYSDIESH
jgi:hypothetical protein